MTVAGMQRSGMQVSPVSLLSQYPTKAAAFCLLFDDETGNLSNKSMSPDETTHVYTPDPIIF
jgi:hypothetical protein